MAPTDTSAPRPRARAAASPCTFYDAGKYVNADSMGHQLMRLMLSLKREVETRMAALGLTDAQWKPLWILQQGTVSTAFELARELGMDAGAVTRMLDRLEAKGLVERVRSETDRRVVNLVLTPAGGAVVAEIPHVLAAVNNDYLRGFSKQEWVQLQDLLGRMHANGEALRQAQGEGE